ncbi:MAG: VWA domain-containing protein [Thermoleophilaceae bacterium]|nr:VWA domain-containing protein [Thermoleophilaceae bacterium]
MSFGSPGYLAALLLVPVLVAAYVWWERRRRAGAEAFASPKLMPAVAPLRPGGVRRHTPALIYGIAMVALLLALAKPERTVAVPEERAAVMLVTDISGSMEATDVNPTRLQAARVASYRFLEDAPKDLRVGLVAFSDSIRAVEAPATDRAPIRDTMQRLGPQGGTATGDALDAALRSLKSRKSSSSGVETKKPPAAIVLLSDGAHTSGKDPVEVAREAKEAKIPINTIALGTDDGEIEVKRRDGSTATRPVPPDRETLDEIAETSGGRTFDANADDELAEVYEKLGSEVATKEEKQQVTGLFAGGAALLVLMGGLMSLTWFGRLP